ncbi:MAG: hypothetical protein ACJ76Y_25015 [Thermoanaerobaculia bacterium]
MNSDTFDPEKDLILFLSFLGLVVAIVLSGFFVLARLRREGGSGRPAPSLVAQVVVGVLLFAIAFVSTFLPTVALVPALMFFVLGLWLLLGAGSRREGGIVLVLLTIAWGLFAKIQADTLASGADIRVDLVLTLPLMTGLGALGWRIYASARIALLQKDS